MRMIFIGSIYANRCPSILPENALKHFLDTVKYVPLDRVIENLRRALTNTGNDNGLTLFENISAAAKNQQDHGIPATPNVIRLISDLLVTRPAAKDVIADASLRNINLELIDRIEDSKPELLHVQGFSRILVTAENFWNIKLITGQRLFYPGSAPLSVVISAYDHVENHRLVFSLEGVWSVLPNCQTIIGSLKKEPGVPSPHIMGESGLLYIDVPDNIHSLFIDAIAQKGCKVYAVPVKYLEGDEWDLSLNITNGPAGQDLARQSLARTNDVFMVCEVDEMILNIDNCEINRLMGFFDRISEIRRKVRRW